jgi:GTPase SAR1 family protein
VNTESIESPLASIVWLFFKLSSNISGQHLLIFLQNTTQSYKIFEIANQINSSISSRYQLQLDPPKMSHEAHRPAFGQSAELGSLYDARTDSFLPLSLLNSGVPIATIVSNDKSESEMKLSFGDSYEEKLFNLNVNPELAASFLSGIVAVDGSAKYLLDNRDSQRILHASIHYSVTTKTERLDVMRKELRPLLTLNQIEGSSATHVVVGIIWGAQTIVTVNRRIGNNEKRAEIESDFQAKLERFESIVRRGGTIEFDNADQQGDEGLIFEVAAYSDLLTDDDLGPDDLYSASKFIQDVPRFIAMENGGKGKPLVYTLFPLDILVYLMQGFVEVKTGLSVSKLPVDCIERSVQFFDELRDAQRNLHDYDLIVKSHRFCVPSKHRHFINKHLSNIKDLEGRVKSNFAYLLGAVRSGRAGHHLVLQLLEACSRDLLPERIARATEEYQQKMNFADMVIGKGAKYIGYGASSDSLEREFQNTDDDIYVLFFDENSKLDQSSWEGNQHLLMELLNDVSFKKTVIVFDCEAGGVKVTKSYIKHQCNGKTIDGDMLETSRENAGKCFARYDEKFLGGSGAEKPLQRSPVKIPCPGHHCSADPQCHDWVCFRCYAAIEYSPVDSNIYCECGRTLYSKYSFRCGSSVHGSIFEEYDSQRLLELLNSLEPFPELNILILGETGVGKSTFINAFINYLSFETLDDAMKEEKLNAVIPCSFAMQYVDKEDPNGAFIEKDIRIGHSTTEHDGAAGQSATQSTSIYPMTVGDTIVRLIDTPGIGDTRGVDQDRENMANILATLRYFPKLHGILILLKPNNSRLNLMFRFCVKELLTHLHRDAARNMVSQVLGKRFHVPCASGL